MLRRDKQTAARLIPKTCEVGFTSGKIMRTITCFVQTFLFLLLKNNHICKD
jgi:hypothetical protein